VSGAEIGAEWAENLVERSVERAWQKMTERGRSAEREVAERERSGQRAESAAHSPLQLKISLTHIVYSPHSTVCKCSLLFQSSLFYSSCTCLVTCSNTPNPLPRLITQPRHSQQDPVHVVDMTQFSEICNLNGRQVTLPYWLIVKFKINVNYCQHIRCAQPMNLKVL